MDETRALARLPHLDVEIEHRRLPDEEAEQLSIRLRASPSFGDVAAFLRSQPMLWPWLALSPLLAWQSAAMEAVLAPWQPAARALGNRPEVHGPDASGDDKVHPFPGPAGRGD